MSSTHAPRALRKRSKELFSQVWGLSRRSLSKARTNATKSPRDRIELFISTRFMVHVLEYRILGSEWFLLQPAAFGERVLLHARPALFSVLRTAWANLSTISASSSSEAL